MGKSPRRNEAGRAVVYHCRTGSFLSPLAAAVHLGRLPAAGATPAEIKRVQYFAQLGRADGGSLHHCGRDRMEREVYVMGDGGRSILIERVVSSAAALAGRDPGSYVFVDCSSALNMLCALGERIWRILPGAGRGESFLAWQASLIYRRIAGLTRRLAGETADPGLLSESPR